MNTTTMPTENTSITTTRTTCAPWCYTAAQRAAGDPSYDEFHTPADCTSDDMDTIRGTNPMNAEWDGYSGLQTLDGWVAAVDTNVHREEDGGHTVSVLIGRVETATGIYCMEGDFVHLDLPAAEQLRDQLTVRIAQARADVNPAAEHQDGEHPSWCNDHHADFHRHLRTVPIRTAGEGEDRQVEVRVCQFAPDEESWRRDWDDGSGQPPEVGPLELTLDGLPHPTGCHDGEDIDVAGSLALATAITEAIAAAAVATGAITTLAGRQ